MKTDILLLADVFENFREQCFSPYGLDPSHYYTTPGYSCDAMLRSTEIKLRLSTVVDMHLFIESGIRGGLSQCSGQYAAANNEHMKQNYVPSKDGTDLTHLDCNNLYGYAMTQFLPLDDFQWEDNFHRIDILLKMMQVSDIFWKLI